MTQNSATKIDILHIMAGADVICAGNERIALGFPEEVVKAWMQKKVGPTAWIVPDIRSHAGSVQWAMEFPLYFALFVQGKFAAKEKIPVLLHERDWADVVDYLRLTLLGLTRDEMRAEGVAASTATMLSLESEYLALKHGDGTVAAIEDFLAPHFFDAEGVVELGGLRVKSHGNNTYSFFSADDRIEEYRLDATTVQKPPYLEPLTPATAPIVPQPFEVITLGTTNGFDPRGPCSNVLVQAHGRFVLIDSGPYIRTLLAHAGVSLDQLGALVITHAHEDHAVGLCALLDLTHRIELFVTRETAAILRRKLAILNPHLSQPETLLDDAFDLTYVEPGVVYDSLGLKLRFHYTFHSIPCTGVEVSMRIDDHVRRALIVGDNDARAHIQKAATNGIVSTERLDQLLALYGWQGDLVVADAGGGLIHGAAPDFASNQSAHVVFVHTGALPDNERHLHTLAESGHRYTIVAQNTRPTPLERGLAHKALAEAFTAGEHDWIGALLDSATPMSVNRGRVVVRAGDTSRDVFVALTGELTVFADRGTARAAPVAMIHAGEVFGEMAVVNGAPRSASVVAATPARLLRIPAEVFESFARSTRLADTLPELWHKRSDLDRVGVLAGASVTTRNLLARHAVRRSIEAGSTLIREGSRSNTVFVLVAGRVQVYKGTAPLLVHGVPVIVDSGALIGETAPFLEKERNASIVAIDECEVLAIRGSDFKRVVERSPQLFCCISGIVKARAA